MDPWTITPTERTRHEEQFRALGPNPMGMVSGAQARQFMLQSGLPPMVLAQVWGLADVNGDGQMDVNEFSIACKLITSKLKGSELPQTLPPQMMPVMPGMMPGMMPQPGMRMNAAAFGSNLFGVSMPGDPMGGMAQPGMMGMAQPGMMGMAQPGMAQPGMMGMAQPGMMGMAQPGMVQPGMVQPGMAQPGMVQPGMMPMVSQAPGMMPVASSAPGMMPVSSAAAPGMMPMASQAAPGMMPGMMPGQQAAVPPVSTPGSGAGTPGQAQVEWAIPQMTRTKYLATFQQTDRARTGFLAGVQARNILLQSGLPQNILAQVWGLSDVDNDGRLSCEEFILSGYLCELAQKGEPLPASLPTNLVPPSMRKGAQTPTGSTPGAGAPSFEDKRKENFNKSQEILEKRRQSLVEEQKKLEEERKRKEKEEAEAKEKQKREAERRRQAEIERQLQKQREAEEQRRLAEEKRWAARQELERQRLKEWEDTRMNELKSHRMREEEKVLTLKARQEHMNADLETLREKVKTLTDNISDTRTGVTDVKTFIDGMRKSRDDKMTDMSSLKAQLKDQNERLIKVTQEKAKMDAKNKARQAKVDEGNADELTEFDIKKKEKEEKVVELRAKLAALKEKEAETREKFEAEKSGLDEHRDQLKKIIEACKSFYTEFDDKRREIKAEKSKRIRELTDPDHAWDAVPEEDNPVAKSPNPVAESGSEAKADFVEYKALYDYSSDNPDDLAFKAGDILIVHPDQPHEPGWLGGELNGKVGWFPEAYAEPLSSSGTSEPAPAASEAKPDTKPESGMYVAVFPYQSEEPGDLVFETGEQIEVTKKESEWWTGKIGDRVGVFPYNYVEPVGAEAAPAPAADSSGEPPADTSLPDANPPLDMGVTSSDSEKNADWKNSASHVTHQVGVSEEAGEAKMERKVSFDQQPSERPPLDRKDSYSGVTRVSFDKPADLYVTSVQSQPEAVQEVPEAAAKVEAAPAKEAGSGNTGTAKRKKKKKSGDEGEGKSGKKPELATVIAPYSAAGKEQLSLQKGQMILVRKRTETGWWQGEIQASGTGTKGRKRQIGWFPASYVKLMGGGAAEKTPEKTATKSDETEAKKPKYRALFTYAGQHDDELAFNAGDVITLLSKDEEAWWKGELDGRVGVFPSNYVEEINYHDQNGNSGWRSNYDDQNDLYSEPWNDQVDQNDQFRSNNDQVEQNVQFRSNYDQVDQNDQFRSNYDQVDQNDPWDDHFGTSDQNDRYDQVPDEEDFSDEFDEKTEEFSEKRYNVINELISTEKDYLECLAIVRDYFIVPLKQNGILAEDEMEIIFINWNDLWLCTNRLYKSLKIRRKMTIKKDINIGDILCENFSQMGAYIRFCSSQLTAAALLQKLVEIKPGFDDFLRQCQSHPQVKGMPLSFFLLKPVKRVMDYPLLVEKLLKYTNSTGHPDFFYLQKSLKLSKELCEQVNEGTRHKENTERLEWLQIHVDRNSELTLDEKLTFNSTTNLMGPRKFLHHGLLKKAKSSKELVAFLFNDFLLLTYPNFSVAPQFSFDKHHELKLKLYRKPLLLNEIAIMESPLDRKKSRDLKEENVEFGIELLNKTEQSTKSICFEALNMHDRKLWILKLKDAIGKYQEKSDQEKAKKYSVESSAMGRLLVIVEQAENLSTKNKVVPQAANAGMLRLVLVSASNLKCPKGKGKVDPYCEVSMGYQEHRTGVINSTCNPKWNSNMQFFIKDPDQDVLCITVFDKDYFSPNEFLGRTEVQISSLISEKRSTLGGPLTKKLALLETETGMVTLRLDLQMFK